MTVRDRAHEPSEAEAERLGTVAAIRQVLSIRDAWTSRGLSHAVSGRLYWHHRYAPTYFVDVQGMTPTSAGTIVSLIMWAYVVGALVVPSLSDRVGLRKRFYVPGMFIAGACMVLSGYALGTPLWIVALMWGIFGGRLHWRSWSRWKWKASVAAWPAPQWALPSLPAIWAAYSPPVVGMWLVGLTPVAGFYFWGGCYMLSAVLFLLLKETGPYIRTAG